MKWEVQGEEHTIRGSWMGDVSIALRGGTWCLWHVQTAHRAFPLVSHDAMSARNEALLTIEASLTMMVSELKEMKGD